MRAFPTAGGFGANSIGGRGGVVYEVTNLSDDGNPGSLRYAINRVGPRTIVFRVGGTIVLGSTLTLRNPYCTIAGQTAPGDGIQLKNAEFRIGSHNCIVRFLRFRPGLDSVLRTSNGPDFVACWLHGYTVNGSVTAGSNIVTGSNTTDLTVGMGVRLVGGATLTITAILSASSFSVSSTFGVTGGVQLEVYATDGESFARHNIVDHCEMWWSTDQQMDVYGNVTDCTYQYCLNAESSDRQNPQIVANNPPQGNAWSAGSITGFEPFWAPMRVTHHHNAYIHNRVRNPECQGFLATAPLGSLTWQFEMRNCIVYNWQADAGSTQFYCAVYSPTEYNNWKAALGWPNNANSNAVAVGQANVVGNYWKKGPTNNPADNNVISTCDFVKMHLADNLGPFNNQASPIDGFGVWVAKGRVPNAGQTIPNPAYWNDNWDITSHSRSTPFPFSAAYPAVISEPSTTLVANLLPIVGCAKLFRNNALVSIRDAASARVTNDVLNGTGVCGGAIHTYTDWTSGVNNVYPVLVGGSAPTDTDHDGIPDAWATAHGLNPTGNPGPVIAANGYSNLENYINELAGDLVVGPPANVPPAPPTGVTVT